MSASVSPIWEKRDDRPPAARNWQPYRRGGVCMSEILTQKNVGTDEKSVYNLKQNGREWNPRKVLHK